MIRTRVGYTGGTKSKPAYTSLGDHTESLQVDFDPRVISYAQLLAAFWASHDPHAPVSSTQYKCAAFYGNAEQERLARESAAAIAARDRRLVTTAILPLTAFHRAEDYHQKYYLRHTPALYREASARFGGDERAFTDSTLSARFNGYSGHFGSEAQLQAELESYGASPAARDYLLRLTPALTDEAPSSCGLRPD